MNTRNDSRRKTPTVPSIERALTIVERLAHSKREMGVSEISQKLKIPKSTTHTIVLTLEKMGYLRKNVASGKYNLGLKLFGLGSIVLARLQFREQALRPLKQLMEKTRLTTHLAILEQDEAVYIEKVEAPGMVKIDTWVGRRMDLHCTGVGKALLAFLDEKSLPELLRPRGLPRHNAKTITSFAKLKQDLEEVRARGYSIDDEEDELGVRCIGAPVFNHRRELVGAISIAGAKSQINEENINALGAMLRETAGDISARLGFE